MDRPSELLRWFDRVIGRHDDYRGVWIGSSDESSPETDTGRGISPNGLPDHLLRWNNSLELFCRLDPVLLVGENPRPFRRHLSSDTIDRFLKICLRWWCAPSR